MTKREHAGGPGLRDVKRRANAAVGSAAAERRRMQRLVKAGCGTQRQAASNGSVTTAGRALHCT
eukprot:349725-Chlamydomonas_euryale.AAC.3